MILLTRKAEFAAAHYYWVDQWSDAENERVFGKCANRHGHGHNYTLEVTVAGEADAVTGFVVDLKRLKDLIQAQVLNIYDHRHLNLEVPEFRHRIPTAENIAISIWERLAAPIENELPGARLHQIRIYEMADLFADYFGPSSGEENRQ